MRPFRPPPSHLLQRHSVRSRLLLQPRRRWPPGHTTPSPFPRSRRRSCRLSPSRCPAATGPIPPSLRAYEIAGSRSPAAASRGNRACSSSQNRPKRRHHIHQRYQHSLITPTLRPVRPSPPGRPEPRQHNLRKRHAIQGGAPREHPLSVAVLQGCSFRCLPFPVSRPLFPVSRLLLLFLIPRWLPTGCRLRPQRRSPPSLPTMPPCRCSIPRSLPSPHHQPWCSTAMARGIWRPQRRRLCGLQMLQQPSPVPRSCGGALTPPLPHPPGRHSSRQQAQRCSSHPRRARLKAFERQLQLSRSQFLGHRFCHRSPPSLRSPLFRNTAARTRAHMASSPQCLRYV
jgi:hypothetical protein